MIFPPLKTCATGTLMLAGCNCMMAARVGSSQSPRVELITQAIAAAPAAPIFAEFKFKLVREVQRSATKAMEVAPMSCREFTDRLMDEMYDGGKSMSTSANAQQDAPATPKFAKLMQENAFLFSSVSMLLLLVADHASEALLYLHTLPYHKHRKNKTKSNPKRGKRTTLQTAASKRLA